MEVRTRGSIEVTPLGGALGAQVDGVVLRTVVGPGTRVPRSAELQDCVVWEGVTVPQGRHTRKVFAGQGVVVGG